MYGWDSGQRPRCSRLGFTDASTTGTAITTGTAPSYGSWTSIGTTTHNAEYMVVSIFDDSSANACLMDIGIYDGSSTYYVVAEKLMHSALRAVDCRATVYALPVHIPSGATLGARAIGGASVTHSVAITLYSSGPGGRPGGSRVVALSPYSGLTVPIGTICDVGGSANTKTITELNASTSNHVIALMTSVGDGYDTSHATGKMRVEIQVGSSSNEYTVISDQMYANTSALDIWQPCVSGWFMVDIPAGSRIVCNAMGTLTNIGTRTFDLSLYGLVA